MGNVINWIDEKLLKFGKWLKRTLKELVAVIGRFFGRLLNWLKKAIGAVEQALAAAGLNAEVAGASTYLHKVSNEEFEEVTYHYSKQGDSYRRDTVINSKPAELVDVPPEFIEAANALGLNDVSQQ